MNVVSLEKNYNFRQQKKSTNEAAREKLLESMAKEMYKDQVRLLNLILQ